jgi:hypothetical protein
VQHPCVVSQLVPVVFYEKVEMWSAPTVLGNEKLSWFDLRKKVMRKLIAQKQAEIKRLNPVQRHVNIAPKSATEVFG